jgi:hypothetical protein
MSLQTVRYTSVSSQTALHPTKTDMATEHVINTLSQTQKYGGSFVKLHIYEICALLGYYAASCENCLSTFRHNVSVPSSRVKITSQKRADLMNIAAEA